MVKSKGDVTGCNLNCALQLRISVRFRMMCAHTRVGAICLNYPGNVKLIDCETPNRPQMAGVNYATPMNRILVFCESGGAHFTCRSHVCASNKKKTFLKTYNSTNRH